MLWGALAVVSFWNLYLWTRLIQFRRPKYSKREAGFLPLARPSDVLSDRYALPPQGRRTLWWFRISAAIGWALALALVFL